LPQSIEESSIDAAEASEALVERIFASTIGLFDLASIHIGDRLGLYRALAEGGPATSGELAGRTGTDERYVREWLEQQAVTDILAVDADAGSALERRYRLPPGHAEALVEADSPMFIAPLGRQALGMLGPLPRLIDAFRTGAGVPYADYGEDTRQGIADLNRVMFVNELGSAWFPAIPDLHERLRAGARVADLGCGVGWSSIAIARAYPNAVVDGLDVDEASIEAARANAAAEGLEERVRFFSQDASDPSLDGDYAVVTIFEALHDMGRPVEALAHARRLLARDGAVIVADERVADRFAAPGDDLERVMYGFSVVHCLAVGRAGHEDSAATGTAMRPDTVREYALAAGFRETTVLPIENDFWRFYRLDP
jgi:2-polyprenyl-3-methyl-5-hydroxy-6-metoxy-1,4-benzoquinol methylase